MVVQSLPQNTIFLSWLGNVQQTNFGHIALLRPLKKRYVIFACILRLKVWHNVEGTQPKVQRQIGICVAVKQVYAVQFLKKNYGRF